MRGKLELPVGVESMNAMAAVAANAKFVVFAGEDSSDLIVRSADDLRVLDVLDCGSVNEITICCQNVVAIANGNRDGLVQLMSLDVPTAQLTINVDDDVCALAGDPTALIVRGFLAIHTWRVEVFGARLFAQPLAQFEMRIALRTRAVTWAPPLGESEDTDILVTVQRQKSDPCVIWRLFIDEDAEGGPALTRLRVSDPVSSPYPASNYPYAEIAASRTRVAAVTMMDFCPYMHFMREGFNAPTDCVLVPQVHVFDADLGFLFEFPLEKLTNLQAKPKEGRFSPRIVIVGQVLLGTSLCGLAINAWSLETGDSLYTCDFFARPDNYTRSLDSLRVIKGHPNARIFDENKAITDIALVGGGTALVIGCFEGYHAVLEATERRRPIREPHPAEVAREFYRLFLAPAKLPSLPTAVVRNIISFLDHSGDCALLALLED